MKETGSSKRENISLLRPATYPFGQDGIPTQGEQTMSLLALSHTPVEHRIYQAMFAETIAAGRRTASFTVQGLATLTGLNSYSTIRRGRSGLIEKLSVERQNVTEGVNARLAAVFFIFSPEEIFDRRRAAGIAPYPAEYKSYEVSAAFSLAIERVVERYELSRREAQVALCCAEGMTNIEIGEKLFICKQTVKFHMRNVFAKCGVKRRTELISRLLMPLNSG